MRTVLQRVGRASVTVDGERIASIGPGLLALVGIAEGDTEHMIDQLAEKIALLRIFPNEAGKFDRSLLDVAGEALVVSQFTLLADTSRGRRPSFIAAARPDLAEPLVDRLVRRLQERGVPTQNGKFGAHMAVELLNDGPVTIVLESPAA